MAAHAPVTCPAASTASENRDGSAPFLGALAASTPCRTSALSSARLGRLNMDGFLFGTDSSTCMKFRTEKGVMQRQIMVGYAWC